MEQMVRSSTSNGSHPHNSLTSPSLVNPIVFVALVKRRLAAEDPRQSYLLWSWSGGGGGQQRRIHGTGASPAAPPVLSPFSSFRGALSRRLICARSQESRTSPCTPWSDCCIDQF
ncbi:hypothetical protein BS78_07G121900 [Paspalum vaginatum]|nr:hypothetical protein BS78_07G121900 [Paspalum vaginatum]KAJ1268255.1 hypothetical protein BS78_07G121900 [Paspalum vaginatum]